MPYMGILFTFCCMLAAIFMLISLARLLQRGKQNEKLVKMMAYSDNTPMFLEKIQTFIESEKNRTLINKAKVLQFWKLVSDGQYEQARYYMEGIDLNALIAKKKKPKKQEIALNEDSFYYLCVSCSSRLYRDNQMELLEDLERMIREKEGALQQFLFYRFYLASCKFYFEQEDHGDATFREIGSGQAKKNYAAKSMREIYEKAAMAMEMRLCEKQFRRFDESKKEILRQWNEDEIGQTFMQNIGLKWK